MVVAGEDANASARLPVPDSYGLVVGGGEDPRILGVEECRANVIQMPEKSENASLLLVVPHLESRKVMKRALNVNFFIYLNFEVVTTRHEERLLVVERDAANWAVVLVELFEKSADSVVPELDDAGVQT